MKNTPGKWLLLVGGDSRSYGYYSFYRGQGVNGESRVKRFW